MQSCVYSTCKAIPHYFVGNFSFPFAWSEITAEAPRKGWVFENWLTPSNCTECSAKLEVEHTLSLQQRLDLSLTLLSYLFPNLFSIKILPWNEIALTWRDRQLWTTFWILAIHKCVATMWRPVTRRGCMPCQIWRINMRSLGHLVPNQFQSFHVLR